MQSHSCTVTAIHPELSTKQDEKAGGRRVVVTFAAAKDLVHRESMAAARGAAGVGGPLDPGVRGLRPAGTGLHGEPLLRGGIGEDARRFGERK